jgi:hypothetical protein
MAGQLKVDSINADSNLSFRIANTAVAFIDSNGLRPVSGNVSLDSTGTTGIRLPAANTLSFHTTGTEDMRITSDGSVLIGGTTDTAQTSGFLVIQRTSTPGLDLFRNETAIADTSVLGQIRFLGNDTTSNNPTQHAYIRATSSGTHAAGDNPTDLVFGTTVDNTSSVAEAGRITQSGAYILKGGTLNPGGIGITFPATQSASSNANTLDDYEEGTWTPSINFNGGITGITYDEQTGVYVKIGQYVYCSMVLNLTNKGSASGSANLTGLPFTILNASGSRATGMTTYFDAGSSITAFPSLLGAVNTTECEMFNSASTKLTNSNFTNTTAIRAFIIYRTSA